MGSRLPDLDVPWNGDLGLDATGDLAMVDGIDLDNNHIERRLLTAVNGYLFHLDYGAGLLQRIGLTALERGIKAIVRQQIYLEATVARIPVPVITVGFKADAAGLCSICIDYTNAVSNTTASIALEVPTSR